MTRLSIIDVQGGHQPMTSEDQSVWVVFNGEIYNQHSLRSQLADRGHHFRSECDTEVLVHGYEEWGSGLLRRLNGMFAMAIWDRGRRQLVLARDRVGIKPLFYRQTNSELVFASELTAMLADPECPRGISPVALSAYLALEFVPSPLSMIRDINTLEPGHLITWSEDAGLVEETYWNVAPGTAEGPPMRQAIAELEDRLTEAVRLEMVSDVPLGVLLSGGVDSSTVAAMMVKVAGRGDSVATFSIGFRDRDFDESGFARMVANYLGTDHHELIADPDTVLEIVPSVLGQLDQPLGDASLLPTYLVSRFAREHVKVVLGGDGGDELFGGYPTLRAHRLARFYRKLPPTIRRLLVEPVVDRMPTSMGNLTFDFKAKRFVHGADLELADRHVAWTGSFAAAAVPEILSSSMRDQLASSDAASMVPRALIEESRRLSELNQVLYLDMKLYLEGDILAKVDRASMMNSLEARVPLLNAHLVEYVAPLPLEYKVSGRLTKRLLRSAVQGQLPPPILKRPKRGFALPLARWLRGPLADEVASSLSPERVTSAGLLDPAPVARLIRDHQEGRSDNRKAIWTLYVLQRWYETQLGTQTRTASVTAGAAPE